MRIPQHDIVCQSPLGVVIPYAAARQKFIKIYPPHKMESKLTKESDIKDLVVTEPIADVCYMLPSDWWTSWISYIQKGEKPADRPGLICNYELVYYTRRRR